MHKVSSNSRRVGRNSLLPVTWTATSLSNGNWCILLSVSSNQRRYYSKVYSQNLKGGFPPHFDWTCVCILEKRGTYTSPQVNEKLNDLEGLEKKYRKQTQMLLYITMCTCTSYMNSGCVLECRDTSTSKVTIWFLYQSLLPPLQTINQLNSRTDEDIHVIQTDVGIKLLHLWCRCVCIPRHIHCLCSTIVAQVYIVIHNSLFPVLFYNP